MGRAFLLSSRTSSSSRYTIARKPSHFGSYTYPPSTASGSGTVGTDFASMGSTGGMTGRSMPMLPPGLPPCAAWWPRSACRPRPQAGSCAVSAAFVPVMR